MKNQIFELCNQIFDELVWLDRKYPDIMDYNNYSNILLSSDLCLIKLKEININEDITLDSNTNFKLLIIHLTDILEKSKNSIIYYDSIDKTLIHRNIITKILKYQLKYISNWTPKS